jgi:hypothetical protein
MSVKVRSDNIGTDFFCPCSYSSCSMCKDGMGLNTDVTHTKRRPSPDQTQANSLIDLCFICVLYMFR